MENLKASKPPGERNSSLVHSTPQTQSVLQPENSEDALTTGITWSERMELDSEDEHHNNSDTSKTVEPISFDKIRVTPVLEATEEFLKTAFSPMENGPCRQLQHQFIVLDTPFTTPPHLDKMIVGECSKNTKSNIFSDIQAHFLDAVGPLTGVLESINGGTELAIDDVEDAVKATLTFWGMLPADVHQYGGRASFRITTRTWWPLLQGPMSCFHQLQKFYLGPPFQRRQPTSARCRP